MLHRTSCPRRAGVAPLLLVAAFTGFAWPLLHSRPEQLRELSTVEFPIACRDGFVVTVGHSSNRLLGLPVAAGPARTLTPHFGTAGTLRATFETDLGVVIRSEEQDSGVRWSWGQRTPFGFDPGFLRARLWEVALNGEPAHELLPELRMAQAVPSGTDCYWLSCGTPSDAPGPTRQWASELKVTPLGGGPSRVIATKLDPFVRLEPLGSGVSWIVRRRGALRGDRCLALPPDYELHMVLDCAGTPELLAQRLYWFEQRMSPLSEDPGHTEFKLMSANLDGGDRREVLNLTGSTEWEERGRLLGTRDGTLYALLFRRPAGTAVSASPVLCALRGESIREIATLRPGVSATWLADGFLYYLVQETYENWLDWTPKGLSAKYVQVLYRAPLAG